jgi:acetaldehyde dehydrogenase/alcohol dehydrogenase
MPSTVRSAHRSLTSPQSPLPAPSFRRSSPATAVAMSAIDMAVRAREAQRQFDGWPEERVDALLLDIAETISAASPVLAAEAVAETGIGNVADKTTKTRFASLGVYRYLAGQPASGVISRDRATGVTEIAAPIGVVLGILPVTNPVATLVFKALITLKGRNAIIISPRDAAADVCGHATRLIRRVLGDHGAPPDLLQCLPARPGRELTEQLMRSSAVALVLATGGPGVVRAAYSCGIPAIGVGAGNAPVWICADADLAAAAGHIVTSKSFDYGVVCGSEQHIVVDRDVAAHFRAALGHAGAVVLSIEERRRLAVALIDEQTGSVRRHLIGRSPAVIARHAGLTLPPGTRLLAVPVEADATRGLWGRERLAPIVTLLEAVDEPHAVALCRSLLANQGRGHTAAIHTTNPERVERFAQQVPVSRLLVNGPAAHGSVGMGNGLPPSFTLGCGTDGGTSTSDNVSFRHLLNVRRVAEYRGPADCVKGHQELPKAGHAIRLPVTSE